MQSEIWQRLGKTLGIGVVAPFMFEAEGQRIEFAALLPQFGNSGGMVVDPDWSKLGLFAKSLLAAGYGYSCIELSDACIDEDLEGSKEMLRDWGWSDSDPKPEWA